VSGTINFDWIDAIASKLCSYRVIERLLDWRNAAKPL
jgi:hypothetical protein